MLVLRLGGLVALGALAGLGQAPWALWPLTLAALTVAFFLHARATRPRAAFGMGWALGLGYFLLTLHWIMQPFQVDAARDGWMAPYALALMAGGLALFWGVGWALAQRWRPAGALALVAAWTLAEVARSVLFTGFPWALIGHVWIGTPLAQLAAFVGPHGLTLLTLLGAAALAQAGRRSFVLAALPVVAGAVAWPLLDPGPAPAPDATLPLVRMVQPNAPQDQKWNPDMADVFYNRLLDATAASPAPDLVVWPETALPYLLEYATPAFETISDLSRGAPVVLGINRREGSRYYNALVVLGRGAQVLAIHDKAHLAPFGEYIPFGDWFARFGIHGLAASEGGGFSAGRVGDVLDIPGIGPALALICYEGIFAEEVGAYTRRPRLMVLITNDAWFGTDAGPQQHLAQERLRAIEQGLPMVRVANTGISAMIDAKGRITASLPLGAEGGLDARLPPALPPTLYARWGDWTALVMLILVSLAALFARPRFSIDPRRARQ
ncbi:MAG: apolipoprotein N-acyltransferase [Limimaricola sp.]|nr:apolipoprotein N-acyltransferase [Limimaricola sp.]